LWHLYDATGAANLFNLPLIAYNGELDKQKQAADAMAEALQAEGLALERLVGPNTAHKYEPETKKELARRFDEMMARGRAPWPKKLRFTTWTLRYNSMAWISLEKLQRHWERARVEAEVLDDGTIRLGTTNVGGFALDLSQSPFRRRGQARLILDGRVLEVRAPDAESPWVVRCTRETSGWSTQGSLSGAYKRPGLQGPIDDAFMDSFILVRPTGQPMNDKVGAWIADELAHATREWRAQFRGQSPVKIDREITDADIAANNLCSGGPAQQPSPRPNHGQTSPALDRDRSSPCRKKIRCRTLRPGPDFPNPLNPQRYVVLNTGFTFCESGNASNALQTPKLPDYAVVDIECRPARLTKHRSRGFLRRGVEVSATFARSQLLESITRLSLFLAPPWGISSS
jgi:hypothetical protein